MDRTASILAGGPVPQLFVFDIDYTLWAAHVDISNGGPFRRDARDLNVAYDCGGDRISLFPEVRAILDGLFRAEVRIASASRTSTPDYSRDLQTTLDIMKYFESESLTQIFPGRKTTHFKILREASGVEYAQMIFFDDESRNIVDVRKLGVTCVHVGREGMTFELLQEGINAFRASRDTGRLPKP